MGGLGRGLGLGRGGLGRGGRGRGTVGRKKMKEKKLAFHIKWHISK